ncbi:MAG: hypothetical protein ABR567_11175 [Myxococcales bacterium]|nr:hypothetical protein [Myxococcales bacterium]
MKRDRRLLIAALILLAIPLAWLWFSSRDAEKRREITLKGVPDFPAPHQQPRRRPFPVSAPAPAPVRPAPKKPPAANHDPMASFVLQPGAGAGLIQVNALFNTPLFDRLRQCLPEQFKGLDNLGRALGGVDLTRDLDRIGVAPEGVAMSGFFEGKPVAESMIGKGASTDEYRGATIFTQAGRKSCAAQLGNLVVSSQQGDCRALIDRALAPTPADASDQLYGDVFLRSDLAGFRNDQMPAEVRALVNNLDGVTVRANVWDSVALTIEGQPRIGRNPDDIARMAQAAVSVLKSQLGEDDVELQTLADMSKVSTASGKLEVNLALPAQDLFDRFKFPCEGRDGG